MSFLRILKRICNSVRRKMIVNTIANKCSAHLYSKLDEGMASTYSIEDYLQGNKQYFLEQARIYLQVKGYLEASASVGTIYRNKRTEERISLTKSILYSPVSDAYKKDAKSWGITLDVSRSGVSIYTEAILEEGLPIEVYNEDLWNNGRTARTIWCKEVCKNLYRSGLFLG
jgi:hypothetical protein